MSSKSRNHNSRPKSRTARHGEQQKVVGSYLLGKTVGEGTFGKVKLAVHVPTGEKVAVKILEKNRIKDQADVRRVNREIKILKKAKNSNVIQLYEVIDTSSAIYLMMENADSGELFDYIVQHRHVAEIQACKFFHQLIDGVEALHRYEITHRDLKPENLLLKNSPNGFIVKIVDFGLSNTHEGGKLLSTACGSPCYAAPEMIAGHKYFGPLADIWSIGVILFALVCGYLPFEDPNTSALYKKILSGEYKPARWLSSEVKDLIRKILEVDPKKRYTIDHIKRHPWYNMVNESAIPKDLAHESSSNAEFRKETLLSVDKAGFDSQAVNDAKLYASKLKKADLRSEPGATKLQSEPQIRSSNPSASPGIITGGHLETLSPPLVPISQPVQPLQPVQPPPQARRPAPVAGAAVLDPLPKGETSIQNSNTATSTPRTVASITAAKPPVPRNSIDRQNWRLRGYRANTEAGDGAKVDPLSVVSTKAVLQTKELGAAVNTSAPSPRNRPVPPSLRVAGPSSPRKPDIATGESPVVPIEAIKVLEDMASSDAVAQRSGSDKENSIVANPPPDELEAVSERPSTRRSHLRTPGRSTRPNTAEYGEFGEATVQPDEIVFMDNPRTVNHVTNKEEYHIPVIVDDGPGVTARAPEVPKSSQPKGAGGRRGRHLKAAAGVVGDTNDGLRGAEAVSVNAISNSPAVSDSKNSRGVIASIGARLLAPMTGKTGQANLSARDAAAQNKASQVGSLAASPGGIVVS